MAELESPSGGRSRQLSSYRARYAVIAALFFGAAVLAAGLDPPYLRLLAPFLVLCLAVVGYLSLDRMILRPLRALVAQFGGDAPAAGFQRPSIRETDELHGAFSRMRARLRPRLCTLLPNSF